VDAAGVPSMARMVTVSGNSAPTVTLTQPANGATFTAPATVNIAASAADPDGTVTKVEFFNGATKLGEDTAAPFAYRWTGVAAGTYTLTARATDNLGLSATSTAAAVTIRAANAPPTATITAPSEGSIFPWHPTITIAATATDSDGTIARVEFFDGSSLLGQDTTAPYSYRFKNAAAGAHALTAKAYDNRGAITTSTAVNISVQRK
jgi:hypothetical protein